MEYFEGSTVIEVEHLCTVVLMNERECRKRLQFCTPFSRIKILVYIFVLVNDTDNSRYPNAAVIASFCSKVGS
jgi:hypothetical protein